MVFYWCYCTIKTAHNFQENIFFVLGSLYAYRPSAIANVTCSCHALQAFMTTT